MRMNIEKLVWPLGLLALIYLILRNFGLLGRTSIADEMDFIEAFKLKRPYSTNRKIGAMVDSVSDIQEKASEIFGSIGTFSDDELKIYGVLRSIMTQADMWRLFQYYKDRYSVELFEHLENNFSRSEMYNVSKIISERWTA